ncbi:MAG TPA: D-glycero-beta-D-manno-heptose-7-phosphate kinase [Pyrinomonadaceae bacterium]|jgi:D-beta-D-heptose 7-phosphate kinase/D-beta-D-heptose 1-phosphate adenosyltransferase|nr:D-glycero-beta-D-manno-heptose-7-phosphate kinase [Pyrinomonadaceae bacterium]
MNQLTAERANEIVAAMRGRTVVVYGDVMLDEFVWGDVTRISPEAPVPVVDIRRESVHLGGAANVLANLCSLGARAAVVGVVGNDRAGERVRAELREAGALDADENLITDVSRPTTLKTRIIAHSQTVVRADRERRAHVDGPVEERVVAALRKLLRGADALVVSDYDKGAVTPGALDEVLPLAEVAGVPALVDPKIRNFNSYRPATLVTPNHHEALRLTSTEDDTDEGIARAARAIRERLGCRSVLITRGERGMMLLEADGEPVYVPTAAREVYDVTGAGDTVIATLAASLAAGATLVEAAMLANHAAGIVVGKVGTATATAEELLASFRPDAVRRG